MHSSVSLYFAIISVPISYTDTSNRNRKGILNLFEIYQASNFSSKMLMSNSTECAEFVAQICNRKQGKEVTLINVNKTKQLLVSTEKIHRKLTGIKTFKDMCNTMFGDDIATPTRSRHVLNILTVVDNLTDTRFDPCHKKVVFIQPTAEAFQI